MNNLLIILSIQNLVAYDSNCFKYESNFQQQWAVIKLSWSTKEIDSALQKLLTGVEMALYKKTAQDIICLLIIRFLYLSII